MNQYDEQKQKHQICKVVMREKQFTYMIPVLLGTVWQLLPPLHQEHTSIADVSDTIFRQAATEETRRMLNRA